MGSWEQNKAKSELSNNAPSTRLCDHCLFIIDREHKILNNPPTKADHQKQTKATLKQKASPQMEILHQVSGFVIVVFTSQKIVLRLKTAHHAEQKTSPRLPGIFPKMNIL